MEEVVEMIRKKTKESREKFISNRSIVERDVEQFAKNLKEVDPKLLEGIGLPEDMSMSSLFPSLYIEPVDVDQYEKEAEEFAALLRKVDEVRNTLIKRAEALINGHREV